MKIINPVPEFQEFVAALVSHLQSPWQTLIIFDFSSEPLPRREDYIVWDADNPGYDFQIITDYGGYFDGHEFYCAFLMPKAPPVQLAQSYARKFDYNYLQKFQTKNTRVFLDGGKAQELKTELL